LPTTDVGSETEDQLEGFQRGRVSASRAIARSAQDDGDETAEPPIGDPEPGGDEVDDPEDESESDAEDDRLFDLLFGPTCDSGDLAAGVRVHEATLKTVAGLAGVFTEIELVK
jgi:hypothetical protein